MEPAKPDPKLKGVRGGNCNRTACQKPNAYGWNVGTHAYYCRECQRDINRLNSADAIKLFGLPYLIAIPSEVSDADREIWKSKAVNFPV